MFDDSSRYGRLAWATDFQFSIVKVALAAAGLALLLAGCAQQPMQTGAGYGSTIDPRLGVSASPRVIADGEPVPKGGGSYLVGHRYMIAGREYVPSDRPSGYSVVGTASWYGDAFHGRRTANGEIFDKRSISAAHPTLPLPSYVRVTNLGNSRSMIVRVNDRGPYHGGRVMDVSQRVAESLDFRGAGTARIRVDYIGKASLAGTDDDKLVATLRTDGQLARLEGMSDGSDAQMAANTGSGLPLPRAPASPPQPTRVARLTGREEPAPDQTEPHTLQPVGRLVKAPVPPARPFEITAVSQPLGRTPRMMGLERKARPRLAVDLGRAGHSNQ